MQPTDDALQGTSSTSWTKSSMAAVPGCPQPDTCTNPPPADVDGQRLLSTGRPSQNSAAGSGGSNAMPGARTVARVVTRTSAMGVGQRPGSVGNQAWRFDRVAGEGKGPSTLAPDAADVVFMLVRQHHHRALVVELDIAAS
jgi:hypothetical protein